MTPSSSVHTRLYPGATTAILVGAVPPGTMPALPGCRAVLWCVETAARHLPPTVSPGTRLILHSLDSFSPETFAPVLEQFLRLDARHLPSLYVLPTALTASVDSYSTFLSHLTAELASHHRARVTRQQDGFRWQQHVLRNLPNYARHRLPASWRNRLCGLPAFVCGAGPSLDVSAPRLAAAAAGGVVFAADSALRTLARHGLAADFVVSIDVAKLPEKCLPETHRPTHVVLSSVSPPGWKQALPGVTPVFVANRQITLDWLADVGLERPALAATESCGSTALDLARFLGCSPICLFGLDLALTTTQRHTSGADVSIYQHSGFNAAQKFPEVPGNYADLVPTHAADDWRALDARLATWPAGLVHNVTDRGARLANTALVHPDNFVPPSSSQDKAAALAALSSPTSPDAAQLETLFARIRAAARHAHDAVPAINDALVAQGPEGVVKQLRPLLADETSGRLLGAFSLKLMPHLLPPIENDPTRWRQLVDEFTELTVSAQSVG